MNNADVSMTSVENERQKKNGEDLRELLVTLRESEDRFDQQTRIFNTTLSAIADFIYIFDRQGKFIYSNQPLLDLLGIPLEEIIGKNFFELNYPADLAAKLQQQIQQVVDTKTIVRDETPFTSPTGESGFYEYIFSPVIGADGSVELVAGSTRDVTGRKQIEQTLLDSKEKFQDLANSISQFAWMTDREGWIFWYNKRWFEYTGTTLEEMQGWGWRKVHHPDHIDRVVKKFEQKLITGEEWEDTFPLRSKTGEYRWFLSRALPIKDKTGEIVRWFGTNTDIEDVRLAEEKLKEADRRKDEFLATLAHELRNPLAPIRSGLEIIRRSDYDKTVIAETIEAMERQTNQIVHLVDDLLEISRITQGKIFLKKERINLKNAVEMAVETSRDLITLNGQNLEIELPEKPVYIYGDFTRISQVLLNLLNNAAKYTEPGGNINLSAVTDNNTVEIRVRDTGIGIPQDMFSTIFEMFKQVKNTCDQPGNGLGIGLSVVKNLVEMHNGSVEADSAGIGKGSEFTIRLPLSEDNSESLDTNTGAKNNDMQTNDNKKPPQYRILVVDDNADALDMMKFLLTMDNHTVHTASDGATAINSIPEFQPEICILDIGLPVMDGYELARLLREKIPGVLLIALSGWGQDEDRRRSKEAGFDHHLVKPVEIEKLQSIFSALGS